jgi:hypothetical protein
MATEQLQRTITYEEWNRSLLDVLLPVLSPERAGSPVLLACDEDSVIAAGEACGLPAAEAVTVFGRAVELRYHLARAGSAEGVRGDTVKFNTSPDHARQVPPFLGVCAVMVLAASRMTAGNGTSTLNYYQRLWETLGSPPGRRAPYDFDYAPWLFKYLAHWLERDQNGRRGLLVLSDQGPSQIGCAINQCLFRQRDKEYLAEFFAHRVRGDSEHLDLLRLLQVSSDRHLLTNRAQAVVSDPELRVMARAAIEQLWHRWDGTVPDSHGGRSWPGVLHLSVNRRLQLTVSAPDAPADFEVGDNGADDRFALSLDALQMLGDRGIRLGKHGQAGVFLPAAGDTLIFEVREDTGLVWVKAATQPQVYVLSRSSEVKRVLAGYLDTGRGSSVLPGTWQLFERVPSERLPADVGVQAEMSARPPVALVGGLRLRGGWLVGFPPRVEVGEVEESLSVLIDGRHVGEVAAGGQLALELGDGDYLVDIGDGVATFTVHMFERNPARVAYGQLGCSLDARGARTGASKEPRLPWVCGALPGQTYSGRLPLLVRARSPSLITRRGVGTRRDPPPVPRWLAAVGLDPKAARWEVQLDDDVAWGLAGRTAFMINPVVPERLDRTAAAAVLSLGSSPRVRSLSPEYPREAARAAFDELQALAAATEEAAE